MIAAIIRYCLKTPSIVLLVIAALIGGGVYSLYQIPVDAIPDIGEKQIIVYADWPGRSPRNVEDQVTYPLSVGLTGTPGVKTLRGMSGFGFSMVFLVFRDDVDFYWARSRVLERLTVAQESLPAGVQARLGPDATALGQILMYTLEGEGFDLAELRSTQDWYIRYSLQSVEDVSEVASIGGFVQQYQIDADPSRMRALNVTMNDLDRAIRESNADSAAKVIEKNGLEYFVRGVGFVKSVADLEAISVRNSGGVPIRVRDVADVHLGPDFRRGALDVAGVEAAGGIVTMRFGANPREVVERLKSRIREIEPGLPAKTLADGTVSKLKIRIVYDRTQIIEETITTLKESVLEELLVVALVVFVFMLHLRTSAAILVTMPVALAISFLGMWICGVDANIMSIAGIAIAIGDVSDMGIIMAENIFRRLTQAPPGKSRFEVVYEGAAEVGEAIWGAVSNTIVSFLPVFALSEQEGRLFRPLAYTKSFAIVASFVLAITLVPVACLYLLKQPKIAKWKAALFSMAGAALITILAHAFLPAGALPAGSLAGWPLAGGIGLIAGILIFRVLTEKMRPAEENPASRLIFFLYTPALRWILRHKALFLTIPASIVLTGFTAWLGFDTLFGPVIRWADNASGAMGKSEIVTTLRHAFPGVGREFMPPLDEGSLLFMPSLLPGASLTQGLDVMAAQDRAIAKIPEVESVAGKLGRSESALDPAPMSMIETVILLKPKSQWRTIHNPRFWQGWPAMTHPLLSRWFPENRYITKEELVAELDAAVRAPGVLPSWLQPIQTRLVMLQTGFRAMMGVKIFGDRIEDIESVAARLEPLIARVPGAVDVVADRIVGKPYVEITILREEAARAGVSQSEIQRTLEQLIGGENISMSVEGRERYPIRIRYAAGERANLEQLGDALVATETGAMVPLSMVAKVNVTVGPAEIKSENGRLVGYVTFNARGRDEVSVVEDAEKLLQSSLADHSLQLPAGCHWQWAGQFENQVRSTKRLAWLVPLCLLLDVVLLYMSFKRWWIAAICFLAIPVSASGGFLLLLFCGVNLSVAVWVGFIALFGVAEDDSVVMATYLEQLLREREPRTVEAVREVVVEAGLKRIRPCLMTTATTVIGLVPVFTTSGRGSDVMQPMALPSIGGMAIQLFTLFLTPCLYCAVEEWRLGRRGNERQDKILT